MGLFSYMSESEREFAIIEAVVENKLMHLDLEFQKIIMEHNIAQTLIEEKILMESGTEDDLTTLYIAEAEEAAQQSQGIISKFISVIKGFFSKIKDFVFGSKDKAPVPEQLPEQVEVEEDPTKLQQATEALMVNIDKVLSGDLSALGLSVPVVAGGALAIKKMAIPGLWDKLKGLVTRSEDLLSKAEKNPPKLNPEQSSKFKGMLSQLRTCGSRISSMAKKLTGNGDSEDSKEDSDKKKQNSSGSSSSGSSDSDSTKFKINTLKKKLEAKHNKLVKKSMDRDAIDRMKSDGKYDRYIEIVKKKDKTKAESQELMSLRDTYMGEDGKTKIHNVASAIRGLDNALRILSGNPKNISKQQNTIDKAISTGETVLKESVDETDDEYLEMLIESFI